MEPSHAPCSSGTPGLSDPPVRLAWTVWGLGAALYLIGFYQRVAPAGMTAELSRAFELSATGLGNLSAFYFYSYVAMQIPTGILADRWGPRRLLSAGALVASLGTVAFALAGGLPWAGAGRLLIGASVAVAFVGMLKLAGHWFAPRQFALATGMALFCGIVGAVFAGVPLRLLVSAFGWRAVMLASAGLTFAVSAAIWVVVRDDPSDRRGAPAPAAVVPVGREHGRHQGERPRDRAGLHGGAALGGGRRQPSAHSTASAWSGTLSSPGSVARPLPGPSYPAAREGRSR